MRLGSHGVGGNKQVTFVGLGSDLTNNSVGGGAARVTYLNYAFRLPT